MILTPAIKGQLTKALKAHASTIPQHAQMQARFNAVLHVFHNHMPHEQAKHATRKYLAKH